MNVLMLLVACPVFAQSFEVASVKAAGPGRGSVDFRVLPGGRLSVTNATLDGVVAMAFGVKRGHLQGGPGWLSVDRFDIEAKADGEPDRVQTMILLQNLLRERFGLEVHREARDGAVFELVVAKGGHKLKRSAADQSRLVLRRNTPENLPGVSYTIVARKISMPRLAGELVGQLNAPVLDKTGLGGEFDFELDFAIDDKPESGVSLFTAIQEQMGLKLLAARGPVEVLVIDRIEKPAGN